MKRVRGSTPYPADRHSAICEAVHGHTCVYLHGSPIEVDTSRLIIRREIAICHNAVGHDWVRRAGCEEGKRPDSRHEGSTIQLALHNVSTISRS